MPACLRFSLPSIHKVLLQGLVGADQKKKGGVKGMLCMLCRTLIDHQCLFALLTSTDAWWHSWHLLEGSRMLHIACINSG